MHDEAGPRQVAHGTMDCMLLLLSPAKSLDFSTPARADLACTAPRFNREAGELVTLLRRRTPAQLAQLMGLSAALAEANATRFRSWADRATAKNAKPALLAFDGAVYRGLEGATLDADELRWAQQHLVILSGLYGALRPLDRLQPHRLEMGTRLENARGGNLYAFWSERVTAHLNRRLRADPEPVVLNLASVEYSRVVERSRLRARFVDCVFEESQDDRHRVVGVFAKRARGLMARWAIRQRAPRPEALEAFDLEGYAFAPAASAPERLVFRRAAIARESPVSAQRLPDPTAAFS